MPQASELVQASSEGHFELAPGALRFVARYEHDGVRMLVMAHNHDVVHGRVDVAAAALQLDDITASSEDGSSVAELSLHAELQNTQPRTEIIHEPGPQWNQVSLTALTSDTEHDPIEHLWSIPGVGRWEGESLVVELPAGRHPVILRADDVHRARSIDAIWVDIQPPLPPP